MEKDFLLHFRLREERSRIRIAKKDLEKQIRKNFKAREDLYSKKRNIALLPLEKPYQKGFVRFFVLRDDVLYSKEADFFQDILKVINTYMYSENRKFQKKIRKYGKKIKIDRPQRIHGIDVRTWLDPKLELTDRQRLYFRKVTEYCPIDEQVKTSYQFIEPWRFRLKIRPHIITHYKPIIGELEREIEEISKYLDQHKRQGIAIKKVFGGNYSWKSKKEYPNHPIQGKQFFQKQSALQIAENYLNDCSREQ